MAESEYDDGSIRLDADGLLIRRYYFPYGSKRIPYAAIRDVQVIHLNAAVAVLNGRYRIWGSGDFLHWWNLDVKRPKRDRALVIRTDARVLPTITPEDPDAVEAILRGTIGRSA